MDFSSLTPLEGGWSGETFLGEVAGERQVVRIYARPGWHGEQAQDVDAALLRLVRGLLPVPEVLDVRRADAVAGMPGLLVTSFLPGFRGDLLLPTLSEKRLTRLGRQVGGLLAVLGGIAMLRAGVFVDGDLGLADFPGEDDLVAWVDGHQETLAHWSADERAGLAEVASTAQELLSTVKRHCLVHSDLNPKNLLVDPDTLAVTGLLDWEFAHAGHPFIDLGNVLRFEREPAYVEAVLAAYVERFGGLPESAVDLARSADLWALVDLAGRRWENPVAERAEHLLRAIAGERDLHAVADPT